MKHLQKFNETSRARTKGSKIKYPDIEYSVSLETNENSINNMFISVPFYLGQEDINDLDFGIPDL